ncbi:MAG: GlcG/HbpS family heme-binding protein, partial [Phycisphaerales bacterium]
MRQQNQSRRSTRPSVPPRFEPLEPRELLSALPDPASALSLNEIKSVFAQCIARATQLGVNATISLVDREGNILGVVRMRDPALPAPFAQSTIIGGGIGGLEGISLPSSIFSTSKAGTAAFLSTRGNAFSTRTAGFIVQQNFPGGAPNQPSGPLFGVQLSSLPTSDLNRLPIGLAADPGGLPLYRNGQPIAGVGVEFDGEYSAPSSRVGSGGESTAEERVAAAALTGFEPPSNIRADNILVGGIRFAFLRAGIPSRDELGTLPDFDALVAANRLTVLSQPTPSPATKFTTTALGTIPGDTIFGFQQNYVESFAVRSAGGNDAFIIQPNAALVRQLSGVNLTTGAVTPIAAISGAAANQIPTGHRVTGLSLDDAGTPDAADDRLLAFDADANRLHTFSATSGAPQSAVNLSSPAATLRDATAQRTGADTFITGISRTTGQLFRMNAATGTAAALTPADGN